MASGCKIVLALFLGVRAHCGSPEWDCADQFRAYMQQFQKTYKDEAEFHLRLAIFANSIQHIREENAKGSNSYTLGPNAFTDMSANEFQASMFGTLPADRSAIRTAYLGVHKTSNRALPDSVDWRTKGAVTPIKYQGHYCGSCWAFSATGSLEGAYQIATGKLLSFSEQQLVDCDKENSGCDGGDIDTAFGYVKANGLDSEASYAYDKNGSKAATCKASTGVIAFPAGSFTGYHDVATDNMQSLLDAVAQQPVSVMIEAASTVFQHYKSGVLSGKCGTALDHSVLIAGYGVDTNSSLKYWLVKNSWGTPWGEDGYIRLLRGKNIEGECGILRAASYPVVSGGAVIV